MGFSCLVSRKFGAPVRGRDVQKDAKRPHDTLSGFGSFGASDKPFRSMRAVRCATAHHFPIEGLERAYRGAGRVCQMARVADRHEMFTICEVARKSMNSLA
ncbi:hypothetical protein TS85_10545 [Sphingomonas hengshuiensis]|uniref:Uncharacterized protein n=1 Tax=Sphingomonas hengshuiensis TaxID=1609977 RepID=A0A7U4LF37_9SPHN|nr:hypothetical protein TS85_10545 [Sphingomonas hengshuiensis]